MRANSRKPLMRSLGEFVGHVWLGLRADPAGRRTRRRNVEERRVESADGSATVTIRRTVIEEVEVAPKETER